MRFCGPSWGDVEALLCMERGWRSTNEHAPEEELEERIATMGYAAVASKEVFLVLATKAAISERTLLSVLDCMGGQTLADCSIYCLAEILQTREERLLGVVECLAGALDEGDDDMVGSIVLAAAGSAWPSVVDVLAATLPRAAWGYVSASDSNAILENCSVGDVRGREDAADDVLCRLLELCPRNLLVSRHSGLRALDSAVAQPKRRAADILISHLSPVDIFGEVSGDIPILDTAAAAGNLPIIRRLLALHEQQVREYGSADVLCEEAILRDAYFGASCQGRIEVLRYLEGHHRIELDSEALFRIAHGMLFKGGEAAMWLFDAYPDVIDARVGSDNLLCAVATTLNKNVIPTVIEHLLEVPRDTLVSLLVSNDCTTAVSSNDVDDNSSGVSRGEGGEAQRHGHALLGDNMYSVFSEASPPGPLFVAVQEDTFTHFIPLLDAVPVAMHVRLASKTLLHVAALLGRLEVLEWLAAAAPRELALARDCHGLTALDYALERKLGLCSDAALALTSFSKSAAK